MPDLPTATLHRMVLPDHVCRFGLRARAMLEQAGYAIDDRPLTTRAAVDAFKAEHGLDTTPLIVIGEERIGGSDALEKWLDARA